MKTISIRLEDSIYEELSEMLKSMGQTKQTFYETFTRTALRERCIPFIVKASVNAAAESGTDSNPAADHNYEQTVNYKKTIDKHIL